MKKYNSPHYKVSILMRQYFGTRVNAALMAAVLCVTWWFRSSRSHHELISEWPLLWKDFSRAPLLPEWQQPPLSTPTVLTVSSPPPTGREEGEGKGVERQLLTRNTRPTLIGSSAPFSVVLSGSLKVEARPRGCRSCLCFSLSKWRRQLGSAAASQIN